MASSNRAALIAQTHKVLKRHFKPAKSPSRSVFGELMFACCLENSFHEDAEAVYAALEADYFDWNEVRVSTVRELAEVMKPLTDPEDSAFRLKRVVQGVFEMLYSFDLEPLVKENIGQAVGKLQSVDGTTPFVIAYVTQHGLGGHSIPVNPGLMDAFCILGIVSEAEAAKGIVPGLERAISKNQGMEYGSIVHNLGVHVVRNRYSSMVKKILIEIDPDCKDRLPKRPSKAESKVEPVESAATQTSARKTKTVKSKKTKGAATASPASAKKKRVKTATNKKTKKKAKVAKKKTTKKKARRPVAKKTTKKKKSSTKRLSRKKPK